MTNRETGPGFPSRECSGPCGGGCSPHSAWTTTECDLQLCPTWMGNSFRSWQGYPALQSSDPRPTFSLLTTKQTRDLQQPTLDGSGTSEAPAMWAQVTGPGGQAASQVPASCRGLQRGEQHWCPQGGWDHFWLPDMTKTHSGAAQNQVAITTGPTSWPHR